MRRTVCFDDVLLEPRYSDIQSRTQINLTTSLTPRTGETLTLPIISAPMDTITEASMAVAMDKAGGLGIIHRYNSIEDQVDLVRDTCTEGTRTGAAIGITGDYLERAEALFEQGCRYICLDVAHGHHQLMRDALEKLRSRFGGDVHLMAGNVATLKSFNDLSDWGADSIRVGVGGGSICSTRVQTGHGIPTLQSVIDCSLSDRDTVLIADGGIKNSGDMVKALAAGADVVMCGSLLAGTNETPGIILHSSDGCSPPKKIYRGMASREAQKTWRGKVGSVEGVSTTVPIKGAVSEVLHDLEWGIRSGLSYTGARNLIELRGRARFIEQTQSSQTESSPHALLRL
jgi:IMP dehydrogenase